MRIFSNPPKKWAFSLIRKVQKMLVQWRLINGKVFHWKVRKSTSHRCEYRRPFIFVHVNGIENLSLIFSLQCQAIQAASDKLFGLVEIIRRRFRCNLQIKQFHIDIFEVLYCVKAFCFTIDDDHYIGTQCCTFLHIIRCQYDGFLQFSYLVDDFPYLTSRNRIHTYNEQQQNKSYIKWLSLENLMCQFDSRSNLLLVHRVLSPPDYR